MFLNVVKDVKKYERNQKRKKINKILCRARGCIFKYIRLLILLTFFNERKKIF